MGVYRVRDLFLVPSVLSMLRVPLAVAFVFMVDRPFWALGVLALAGVTDVVDGWYARRFDQVTATGAVVDPITDKIFVLTVVLTLVVEDRLSLVQMLMLGTRDIGELPLVIWLSFSESARRARQEQASANVPGKIATLMQFATVTAVLLAPSAAPWLLYLTAAVGLAAALSYWMRAARPAQR